MTIEMPENPTMTAWRLLNRRKAYTIVAIVFAVVATVGIPLWFVGASRAAVFCSGISVFMAATLLWARHRESPELFNKRIERLQADSWEARYSVRTTETEIELSDPDGRKSVLAWTEMDSVRIVTTDSGPWLCDYWLVLAGTEISISIPLGASNYQDLFERLQRLPGWDFAQAIEALGSTSDCEFLCWDRRESNVTIPRPTVTN